MTGERDLGQTYPIENIGWIDFECRSETPIEHGTYRYASDADAIILAWAIGEGAVNLSVVPDFKLPLDWADIPIEIWQHHERVIKGEAIWCAWNAPFDKAIWNYAATGLPRMEPHYIIDAMVQATASGLPPDLATASKILGSSLKLDTGKKLIDLFCVPGAKGSPESHPEQWLAFQDYARADIEAMRSVFKATRQLPLAEWREFWAMECINERGIGVDLAMASVASRLAKIDKVKSGHELFAITRGQISSPGQVGRMVGWLLNQLPDEGKAIVTKRVEETDENGFVKRPPKYSLTRARIERLLAYVTATLEDVNTPANTLTELLRAQRVLQIRLFGGSTTPAKFDRILDQHVEGVLYGQYMFSGAAQTGRASSRGVQVHNLSRLTLPYEHTAIEALLDSCDYDTFKSLGDDTPVSRKLSLLIRPTFVPDLERLFVWSDWSQIEARILPWLAGHDPGALARLQLFRDVDANPYLPDLYTRTASSLSLLPIEQVSKDIRQRGKVAELALGFAGGVGALQAMGAGLGLHVKDAEARVIVDRWRATNAWCVKFWEQLWAAATTALKLPGVPQAAGRIFYIYQPYELGGSLICRLPSGRCLTYRDIRYERVADLDDDDQVVGYSTHLRFSRAYGIGPKGRVKLWRGLFTENVVQAVAADFLRGTLRRLEDEGFAVRLHTHDEVLVETEASEAEAVMLRLREIMRRGFDWSEGLPLMTQETISPYYTKHEV